jgi:tetratricopeptide (TPR) repeat protein
MRRELLVGFLLVAAVTLVYWPVHSYPFVILDDPGYVSQNAFVRKGLTSKGAVYAFTGVAVGNWQPITLLSHMLDSQIYGAKEADAGGHHLTNVFLHAANTLLLFIALRRMTGAVWRSGLAAALFGLHPLHVESVAWISERKDVLSTFFFMLMLLAYHHYAQRRTAMRYIAVFALLLLGLLSKPMLVTAPFVLLLLDFWPLGRMRFATAAANDTQEEDPEEGDEIAEDGTDRDVDGDSAEVDTEEDEENEVDQDVSESDIEAEDAASTVDQWTPLQLVIEKIPFFVLAALGALMTLYVQAGSGAMGMLGHVSFLTRLSNAICAYGIYLEKAFWPSRLAAIYPYTTHAWTDVLVIGVAIVAISIAAYRLSRLQPYLTVGWWWYVITLVPVIGLVQVGVQSMADRYTYIPLIGPFIIAAWGGAELIEGLSASLRAAAIVAVAAVLCIFAWLTAQQVTSWSSSEVLFQRAVDVAPENYVALESLGMLYWQKGRLEDAKKQFEAIVNLETDKRFHIAGGLEPGHRDLGALLAAQHKFPQAMDQLDQAIAMKPTQPDARRLKAWLLATYKDDQYRNGNEAVRLALEAEALSTSKPPEIWDTVAVAEAENWDFEKAIAAEEKAIEAAHRFGAEDMLPDLEKRLKMFKAGEKYREEPRLPPRS